jgi:hypothetical protein
MSFSAGAVRGRGEPKTKAPSMSKAPVLVKVDTTALDKDFMFAFAEDPKETLPDPKYLVKSSVMAQAGGPREISVRQMGTAGAQAGARKQPGIRGPPGSMRAARLMSSMMGRPLGQGLAPVLPPSLIVTHGQSVGDDTVFSVSTDGGSAPTPVELSAVSRALEHAMIHGRGESSAHDLEQDDLSIPNWFSLMQSGLEYDEGWETYSGPCLGLVVSNTEVASSLGSEVFDPDTDYFFIVAPLVSASQSLSSLGALYTYKPDSEKRITEYARFLTSPLVPVAAGSLQTRDALTSAPGTTSVSCEGKVVFRVEDLLAALSHYETHSPSMKAISDIFRAKHPASHVLSVRCLMRTPPGFWSGDTILHTVAKVCICARAPVPMPSIGHMVTPGYKATLLYNWNTWM